jgi:hypothetical protein
MDFHSKQNAIYEHGIKMPTNLKPSSRFIHTFLVWIKPANLIQVIGQLQNLHDVGRSLQSAENSEFLALLKTDQSPANIR